VSFTVKIDEADFANKIRLLARHMGVSLFDGLKGQVKLVTKDIVKMTPPHGKSPLSESWAEQRAIGRDKVRKDLTPKRTKKGTGIFEESSQAKIGNKDASLGFLWYDKDWKGYFFTRKENWKPNATFKDMDKWKNSRRNSKGRVVRFNQPKLVINKSGVNKGKRLFIVGGMGVKSGQIEKYIKHAQKMVWTAKAGWKKACESLGIPLPTYGRRQSGDYEETKGESPSITLWNSTPYVQSYFFKNSIIDAALRRRLPMLQKQIEMTIKANDRKGIFR